ncbi:acyltransferase 3 [Gordonia polyisoprenivorans VH2]|uniref:Acyltransferase 3 n=1 Tax=Gordonia polyisoprenivorans (strain DSM 44266 / VH2) TaxID=1112204 RepID=H6MRV1_GORPV|nr:acyltransferase family protein [Gordonia polyisoprenivorans]AFA73757.1 acyltransferase 3 [Gordonia polyisoprenivorans VH2]
MATTQAVRTRPGSATPAAQSYRTDLDGLRGIAIALVACFHIWFGRVSGGVDVFLTLSGFFFIGSLLRHTIASQSGEIGLAATINPWPRLRRLLRRLLPALLTVLGAVLILTVLLLPPTRWANIGRELTASALYYQNWYLALNSQDYLAASSANSPLQHIWSMSVQGQFFLATLLVALGFAGLVKLAARVIAPIAAPHSIRVCVGVALLGASAISFYWADMRMGVNQQWNYFDTLSRLWEPLAGGLLAVWLPRWRIPSAVRTLAGAIALGLIITCGWWIDGVDSYPGPWALVPVGSTLILIWAGAATLEQRSGARHARPTHPLPMISRLLASSVPVWLGTIAYALYLWHWPLLIFFLNWRGKEHASFLDGACLLAVSIGLAWLTKRYIEDPLRTGTAPGGRGRATRRLPSYTAVLTSILLVLSMSGAVAIGMWQRHVSTLTVDTADLDPRDYPGARALLDGAPVPALDPQPTPLAVIEDFPETSTDGYMSSFEDPSIHVGVYGDPNAQRTIALAGGSHAEMWISALHLLGKRHHFRVTTYLKMGCPLSTEELPSMQNGVPYPQCHDWVQRVIPRILADRPDAVFTTSTRPDTAAAGDVLPDTYVPVFERFTDAGIPVLGMRDTPWPHDARGAIDTPTCLADGGNGESCGTDRASALDARDPAEALAATDPLFHALDLSDGVCTPERCPAIVGNTIVYKDWHHLSATYVRSLTDGLGVQLRRALPWAGGVGG